MCATLLMAMRRCRGRTLTQTLTVPSNSADSTLIGLCTQHSVGMSKACAGIGVALADGAAHGDDFGQMAVCQSIAPVREP